MKGGKHGHTVVAGDPEKSKLVEMIRGPEPDMPKDADPLKAEQVAMHRRGGCKEGARTTPPPPGRRNVEPPVYTVPPVITGDRLLAGRVAAGGRGYHEVLLHKADGSGIVAPAGGRSRRGSSRSRSSKDGKLLAAAGGSPAEFGQVQVWDVADPQERQDLPAQHRLALRRQLLARRQDRRLRRGRQGRPADQHRRRQGRTDFQPTPTGCSRPLFTLDGKQSSPAGATRR